MISLKSRAFSQRTEPLVPLTMKLPALIDLSLILILTSYSKGQDWTINVTQHYNATKNSTVTILCTFTYPNEYHTDAVQVYWKKPGKSSFNTGDKDTNQFVFHTNEKLVEKKYRGRTKLIGEKDNGNCSLRIQNVMDNEQSLYMRIIANGQNYSFKREPVSISVSGVATVVLSQGTNPPLFTAATPRICSHKKCKRSQSLTREESGYYANFSRASDDPAQREASCNIQQNKTFSEPNIIDEPIYVNTEVLTGQMDEDDIHNVYGNVDYS
ncbi:sialic acid-binding Ig-like lectin 5 isoform X4 [Hippoglossus stenolepis]|uniref:sialic acid-binding Ig-like lectin 5 isoform X4 n=1 Tax=Hippoglossus stenolepis TaxID=195615 RepID=UPI001FAEE9B9|nr:sialic acid-binding Ig-like lectin 5 isoform X4 [Hippoglossus stenolepis]